MQRGEGEQIDETAVSFNSNQLISNSKVWALQANNVGLSWNWAEMEPI